MLLARDRFGSTVRIRALGDPFFPSIIDAAEREPEWRSFSLICTPVRWFRILQLLSEPRRGASWPRHERSPLIASRRRAERSLLDHAQPESGLQRVKVTCVTANTRKCADCRSN